MTNKILIISAAILAISQAAFAGETEFPLFKVGAGGRAVSMGGAFTGIADDASAVFWNPAGLAQVSSPISIAFTDRLNFQSSKFLEFFASYSDLKYGSFGVGVLSNQIDDIIETDTDRNLLGTFGAYQRAIMIGYAYNLTPVYVGINLASVQSGMDPSSGDIKGSGFSLGLGLMTRVTGNLKIGSIIRPGYSIKFDDSKDDIPGSTRLGAEFTMRTGLTSANDSLRLALDLDQANKMPLKLNAGLELSFMNLIALRGGLNSFMIESRTEEIKHSDLLSANLKFCFGVGLKFDIVDTGKLGLDVGVISTSLGSATAISLSWMR
jgi:long-subunit fatty acid transport protein